MKKTTGTPPPPPPMSGKLLDLRSRIEAKKAATEVQETDEVDEPQQGHEVAGDKFAPGSKGAAVVEQLPDGERGGGVKARLHALGVKAEGLIKTAGRDKVRITDTPAGKILEGSVIAESAAGLQRLLGVVKAHEIGMQEPLIKSADLLVLKSLIEVDRFTIEGSPTLGTLDALAALERGRSIYIGFNAALSKIVLPRLKEVDVLIIEGNAKLREVIMPMLEKVGRYFHIQDNPALELVHIGRKDKPVQMGELELSGNLHASYPHIYATSSES